MFFLYCLAPKDLTYDEVPLDQVKTRVIDVIVAKTVQWLNENLVGRFNSLYNETWVPKGVYALLNLGKQTI